MKKLPIGLQTFSHLIEQNCVYVDKTAIIHQLITQGSYYFFSRPRRFGKSLLVSTLAAIFSGKKELFAGLAISNMSYEWKKHPVVMISLSDIPCTNPERFEVGLKNYLQKIAKKYDIVLSLELSPGEMLRQLVIELYAQGPVVLLIDEYDYPILQHIDDSVIAVQMRDVLRDFYIVVKGLDPYLRFVFLTGISQFSKTSIFSGLNNLNDISLSDRYNALVGYTRLELVNYFQEYFISAAEKFGRSFDQLLEEVKVWYDGYRFTREEDFDPIYNPFSVLLFLDKKAFSNYWFATGIPTFLIKLLKTRHYPMQKFEGIEATEGELGQFEVDDINLKTLLFQAGYLTIKSYDHEIRNYVLDYANKETIDGLSEYIIKSMVGVESPNVNKMALELLKAFVQFDCDKIFALLTHFFADIPYTIQIGEEKYYQTIFYLILKMMGADIIVEYPTNTGRIDAVLQTKDTYYIIEFKINSTAIKAIEQIESKKYYQPYENNGKKIVLVGIAFDTTARNVSEIEYKNY
jgi:hypothetical protein